MYDLEITMAFHGNPALDASCRFLLRRLKEMPCEMPCRPSSHEMTTPLLFQAHTTLHDGDATPSQTGLQAVDRLRDVLSRPPLDTHLYFGTLAPPHQTLCHPSSQQVPRPVSCYPLETCWGLGVCFGTPRNNLSRCHSWGPGCITASRSKVISMYCGLATLVQHN
jgi:hypothetical protein